MDITTSKILKQLNC